MKLKKINKKFTVCQISALSDVNFDDEFCFVSKTDDELSLVCSLDYAPQNTIKREDGWIAFKIEAVLDFSLVGILSKISTHLADKGISIFAISTYNTDYILVKNLESTKAIDVLQSHGYTFAK